MLKTNHSRDRLLEYLATTPSSAQLAMNLQFFFLLKHDVSFVGLSWLQEDNGLEIIGRYGECPVLARENLVSEIGDIYPASDWHNHDHEIMEMMRGSLDGDWSADGFHYIYKMMKSGVAIGFILLEFKKSQSELHQVEFEEKMHSILPIVTLYIVLERERTRLFQITSDLLFSPPPQLSDAKNLLQISQLSPRMLAILKGMADKKTNAKIANESGFSESTIHADCTKIYEILNVSTRQEAVLALADLMAEISE